MFHSGFTNNMNQMMIDSNMNQMMLPMNNMNMMIQMNSMGMSCNSEEMQICSFLMKINSYIYFLQDYLLYCLEKGTKQEKDLNYLRSTINNHMINLETNTGMNIGMMGLQSSISMRINEIKLNMNKFFCQLNSFDKVKKDYFEADKIKIENDMITSKIFEKVSGLSKGIESKINNLETEGKFLFAIGKIARKSLKIANQIHYELFQNFRSKEKLTSSQEENRKNYSAWMKKFLQENENSFFKIQATKNEGIIKYMNSKYEPFFIELFPDLIKLYLECALSIPLIEVSFDLDTNNKFDNRIMTDLFLKGKPTKINFCYLPELKSNGSQIPGGKFYVFTYLEGKTYREYQDLEIVKQNINLNYM